jgi:hypothetical protein
MDDDERLIIDQSERNGSLFSVILAVVLQL